VLSSAETQTLARWAQVASLSCELADEGPRVGTIAMGQQLRGGGLLPYSEAFLARLPRD
jgi:hypothetical protein